MPRLTISLLGPPRIELNGDIVHIGRSKAVALLAYLALNQQSVRRDTLTSLLWPEASHVQARATLRTTLAHLTRKLGKSWFDSQRQTIQLKFEEGIWVDVGHFQATAAELLTHEHKLDEVCPSCLPILEEIVALYKDEFLVGFTLRDSAAFDEWQRRNASRLRQDTLDALARLVQGYGNQQNYKKALAYATRQLEFDMLQERYHRELMRIYAALGDSAAVQKQYETCQALLQQELGVSVDEETTQLYQCLHLDTPGSIAPVSSPLSAPSPVQPTQTDTPATIHIPYQGTPFFGRQKELNEIVDLLSAPQCRLVTLIGIGGIGKTRLAVESAQAFLSKNGMVSSSVALFTDGIVFVPLASIDTADQIIPTLAHFLGFSFYGKESPKQQLLNYLRAKSMLLIFDNFEHILEGGHLLTDLLAVAPHIKVVVTSRERLRLPEEWLVAIDGMVYPTEDSGVNVDTVTVEPSQYSALELFIQRAKRVYAQFSYEKNLDYMVRLCQLVEGMPLGLELAAAQTRLHSCREIVEQLAENLAFLNSNRLDIPKRHRSLHAVFTYSWQLLTDVEQIVLHRLTIFRGGFTQKEAQVVTQASPNMLASLLDKSLLQRNVNARFDLHETLRQFLQEMRPVEAVIQERHSAYYLNFLRSHEQALRGSELQIALEEITVALDNIRMAWEWSVSQAKIEQIEMSIKAFAEVFRYRGSIHEGALHFRLALERLESYLPEGEQNKRYHAQLLARLAVAQSCFLYRLAKYEEALASLEKAESFNQLLPTQEITLSIYLEKGRVLWGKGENDLAQQVAETALQICDLIGDVPVKISILSLLGNIQLRYGEYEQASSYYQEALTLCLETNNLSEEVGILNGLAIIAFYQGMYDESRSFFEDTLKVSRQLGNRSREGIALSNLGNVAHIQGFFAEAQLAYESSIAICRQIGNRVMEVTALNNLGQVSHFQGQHEKAYALLSESLQIREEIGDRPGQVDTLNNLGLVALNTGDFPEAQKFLNQAIDLAREIGSKRLEMMILDCLGQTALRQGSYQDAHSLLEQSLSLSRELGNKREESEALYHLGLLHHVQADFDNAQSLYDEALQIRQSIGLTKEAGITLVNLGHLAQDREALAEAQAYYQAAQTGLASIAFTPHVLGGLVGLATLAQARGDVALAQQHVQAVWEYLEEHELQGDWWPMRVSLMCWQLLSAWQDGRADFLLEKMVVTIKKQAENVLDKRQRALFLEDVPENRKIFGLYGAG